MYFPGPNCAGFFPMDAVVLYPEPPATRLAEAEMFEQAAERFNAGSPDATDPETDRPTAGEQAGSNDVSIEIHGGL